MCPNGDPVELAALCHRRVKTSRETVAKALQGDYRREHMFVLKQSLDAYRYYQRLIAELDEELATYLKELPTSEVDRIQTTEEDQAPAVSEGA